MEDYQAAEEVTAGLAPERVEAESPWRGWAATVKGVCGLPGRLRTWVAAVPEAD